MTTQLFQGDCLELMRDIPDHSVDMVLCDLPYGTTSRNEWDKPLDMEKLWPQYKRVIKSGGAIVLFSQLPFACDLISGNRKQFRYEIVWEKNNSVGFLNANRMPLRAHENILVFYERLPTYNPQKGEGKPYKRIRRNPATQNYGQQERTTSTICENGKRFPRDVIKFGFERGLHPTQKPVPLLEYLIKTYTNEGDTVLDNCMGSGSTGVACVNTGRNFIGMELDETYFKIAKNRIEQAKA
jgi:site-specific DNA-methyltransferase (adenine-specific)